MQRQIQFIVVHRSSGINTNETIRSKGFHYIVQRNGSIQKLHPETTTTSNMAAIDEAAIHIGYVSHQPQTLAITVDIAKRQEEALFNKLVGLSVKYPRASIKGGDEFKTTIPPCLQLKEWLQAYQPNLKAA